MQAHQARRGPDDAGVAEYRCADGVAVLGHRRLSILDLSVAGHQPMERRVEGGILSVTFNGEIYNFRELKKELTEAGERFSTETDTEVILALFAREGPACLAKLRGMFAFGLWDSRSETLYLVRDRFGIKPLYYSVLDDGIVFASTVGALAASGLVSLEKDPRALPAFLLTGSVPLPWTTLRAVSAIPQGSYLMWRSGESPKLTRYYDLLTAYIKKREMSFVEAVVEARRLCSEAVVGHLISDAPLGVFLSGGLDSSAITAFAAKERGEEGLTTLSIAFDEAEYSEARFQRMMAKRIHSDHKEYTVRSEDFKTSFREVFEAMDQPTVDGVNTFFVARAAKEAGLKAVLSGLGGDEIFFGYPAFTRARALRFVSHLPPLVRTFAASPLILGRRSSKAAYLRRGDLLGEYLTVRGLFTPREAAELLGADEREIQGVLEALTSVMVPEGDELRTLTSLHPADAFSYLELRNYLHSQLLKDSDYMAMHHSIEVRVPFLDHLLVEFLASLSASLKLPQGGLTKPLLVEAVRDSVPREVFDRPKMGFTFPFAEWLGAAAGEHDVFHALVVTADGEDILFHFASRDLHWSRLWAATLATRWR